MVNGLRLHVQHRLGACGRHASCLLDDVGHRIALIQEPELQRNRVRWTSVASCQNSHAMPLKFREEFQLLNCCLISASAFAHLSGAGCPSPTLSRRLGASADTYHICLWGHLWSTSTCLVTFMLMKAWPSHLGV